MTTFVTASAVFLGALLCYRLLFSPLAGLPGPWTCALTRIPLVYHELRGKRRSFIHGLHVRYGPVVRIAPNEVSFASREAVKEIYTSSGGGYDKSSFYKLFANFDRPNMFSTMERGEHSDRKRQFAERYSKTHVMKPEVASVVQDHAEAFISRVADNLGASIDVYDWLHCYALDGITGHLFYPRGLHSLTDPEDHKIMHELSYSNGLVSSYARHYFPLLHKLYTALKSGKRRRSDGLAGPYVLRSSEDAHAASHTVISKLRAVYPSATASGPGDWKLAASECMDHVAAGIDTTGDGLCFLMHHLSLPTPAAERVQARLRAELAPHADAPLSLAAVLALPYLDAVVQEGLRVYSPIPMSLPRVVPEGGRMIDGVRLPSGTVVSCQPYTLHRLDQTVWANPEEFRPERWLEGDGVAERNQLFFAFAAGGRGCIGKHLALLEMKLLLTEVYSRYRTRIAPDMTASMEQDDQVIASRPKGQKCLLVFEKADDI